MVTIDIYVKRGVGGQVVVQLHGECRALYELCEEAQDDPGFHGESWVIGKQTWDAHGKRRYNAADNMHFDSFLEGMQRLRDFVEVEEMLHADPQHPPIVTYHDLADLDQLPGLPS